MRAPVRLLLLATLLLPVRPASLEAQDTHLAVLREAVQTRLEAVAREHEDVAGFHVLSVTSNQGSDGGTVISEISAPARDHFSRLAGVTAHGTRVLEVKRRVPGGDS